MYIELNKTCGSGSTVGLWYDDVGTSQTWCQGSGCRLPMTVLESHGVNVQTHADTHKREHLGWLTAHDATYIIRLTCKAAVRVRGIPATDT